MTLYQEIKDASNKKLYLTNEEIEALYKEENAFITYRYKEVLQTIKKMLSDDCAITGFNCDSIKNTDKTEYEEYEEIVTKIKAVLKEKREFEKAHKGDELQRFQWLFNPSQEEIMKDANYCYEINKYEAIIASYREDFNKLFRPIMHELERARDNFFIFGKNGLKRVKPSEELIKTVSAGCLDIPYYYAKKYRKYTDYDFNYDDLFETACVGLLYAANNYIPDGPAKFRTYASACVENNIKWTVFKNIKKKYKDDFFKDQLDKTILAYKILNYLSDKNNTVISDQILNIYIRNYNRSRTKTAETTLPLFKGEFDYNTAKDFFEKLINSLEMNKLLTDDDLRASYEMTLKKVKKEPEITFHNWKKDLSKPYNNNFELQKNKLIIYGVKITAIREMIEYEHQYKRDNNGNLPTYDEQYFHIKEYFKSMFKGKRKIRGKSPSCLEDFNNVYYRNYRVNFGFDALENKELERKAAGKVYLECYLSPVFNNWDSLLAQYENDGKFLKPFMEFGNLIEPNDDYRTICIKYAKYRHGNGFLKLLQDYAKKLCKESSLGQDSGNGIHEFNELFPKFQTIFDQIDHSYIPGDRYYNLSKEVKPLLIHMGYVNEDDNDLVVYNKFVEKYGFFTAEDSSKCDLFVDDMVNYRRYATRMEVKKTNNEITQRNRELMKYIDSLFFAQRHITLDDFKGFDNARNKLYELHEEFDCDQNNNKNCRPSVEDEAINNHFIEEYKKILHEELTEEEAKIMVLAYDNRGYRDLTSKEIAARLNLKPSQVTYLKGKAIKKLRNSSLKAYLD